MPHHYQIAKKGQLWGAMSEEEKSIYQVKAAEERERVAKELEAWKAAGGEIEVEKSNIRQNTTNDNRSIKLCRVFFS